jgi:hypothetical protein
MRPEEGDGTRERFLSAISEKVPADKVAEVHLFQPMRQSGFESGVAVVAVEEESASRLAVFTAKYRLTLKGADRGKWDFDMHVDADAPLVTVDRVVRGVQRRVGDAVDPEKLSGDEFRALLPPREPAQGQPT